MSFIEHFSKLASQHTSREALLYFNEEGELQETHTFKEMKESIETRALWFQKGLGLAAGDALALALPNSTDLLLFSWAAWASGIVTVPLDIRYDSAKEHLYKIQLSGAKAVLAGKTLSPAGREELEKAVKVRDAGEFAAFKGEGDNSVFLEGTDHTALILFTSGTTAKPKGAELTLGNLLCNAEGIKDWFSVSEKDRFLVLLPLFHINSTSFTLASLLGGAGIAVVPSYSNSRFWEQLAKTQSTFTSIVPTICYDQLSRKKEFAEAKEGLLVNRMQIGSAPVVASDAKLFMEQFGIPLFQGYGQTETALRVTGVPLNLPEDVYRKLVEQNSIGKAMGWADVQILKGNGEFAKEGEEGEIAVKGPAVMKGYLQNPEANEQAFKQGYFLTGDLGYFKEIEGTRYFFLKGRIKEIIIKGGENLSPVAIESSVKEMCPEVAQVFALGVPDKRYGEEVAALVSLKEGELKEKALAKVKDQLFSPFQDLAPFERPKYLAQIGKERVPRTPTGKVQRQLLKELVPVDAFEKVSFLAKNDSYTFLRLSKEERSLFKQALELFNRCWSPLSADEKTFSVHVQNGTVLIAVDREEKVQGLLSFIRTSKIEEEISKMSYQEITSDLELSNNESEGDKIVCVSICSSSVKEQEIPKEDVPAPSPEEMKEYLGSGADLVYNFHRKGKAGLGGAELAALIPKARPQDKLSLGYAMLLRYPLVPKEGNIVPEASSSVAVQLIEAGMRFAQVRDIEHLYAFSRPAGAYQYFLKKS